MISVRNFWNRQRRSSKRKEQYIWCQLILNLFSIHIWTHISANSLTISMKPMRGASKKSLKKFQIMLLTEQHNLQGIERKGICSVTIKRKPLKIYLIMPSNPKRIFFKGVVKQKPRNNWQMRQIRLLNKRYKTCWGFLWILGCKKYFQLPRKPCRETKKLRR